MSNLEKYLDINEKVKKALKNNEPIVALESTIISHGMPYPQNVETALKAEEIIEKNGAVPATIAIIKGKLKVGLSHDEIDYLGKKGLKVNKASRRDLGTLLALKEDGATTVAATMIIAHLAKIKVFATGGIGGVHRGAEKTMDISSDLLELAHTPVMVICAGAKSILDLALTTEYLETQGICLIGYNTDYLPAFYCRESDQKVTYNLKTPESIARVYKAQRDINLNNGLLVTNPIPIEDAMDKKYMDKIIKNAVEEAQDKGIKGKEITPFLLDKIKTLTSGDSLKANIALLFNNVHLAVNIAKELSKMEK